MKKLISVVVALLATFIMAGCGSVELSPQQQALISNKTTVYTQVNMWEEKNRIYGTNYAKGAMIPVNSPVTIVDVTSKAIVFNYKGAEYTYLTFSKHTKATSQQLLARLFSTKKVNLGRFTKEERENIKNGVVAIGMSKDAVLIARGYPPFHVTTSLKDDKWTYWRHRFARAFVFFKNGKVSSIQGTL